MTEPTTPPNPEGTGSDQATPDETFTWTGDAGTSHDAPHADDAGSHAPATATNILESFRDAVDDLAERATPTVREFSARAAELTAVAADKAAPFARRAGEVTSEASGKLAAKSRLWAADLRASMAGTGSATTTPAAPTDIPPTPRPAPDAGGAPTEGPGPA